MKEDFFKRAIEFMDFAGDGEDDSIETSDTKSVEEIPFEAVPLSVRDRSKEFDSEILLEKDRIKWCYRNLALLERIIQRLQIHRSHNYRRKQS